jgi:hypothetical protein
MRYQRPAALTAATVICVLNSLGNLAILPAPIPRLFVYASGVAGPILLTLPSLTPIIDSDSY